MTYPRGGHGVLEYTRSGPDDGIGRYSDLELWAKFDESSGNCIDSSKNANSGVVTGATQGQPGHIDDAIDFDGNNDDVLWDDNLFPSLSGDYTFSTWINATANDTYMCMLSFEDSVDDNFFYITGGNALRLWNGSNQDSNTVTSLTDGTWRHVAFVRSGTTLTFYIDGSAEGTTTHTGTMVPVDLRTGDNGWSENFDGLLDDYRIYSIALTSTEIGILASA